MSESLAIWNAFHKLQDAISVFEAWETECSVLSLQHVVIVCLHALLPNPTLDLYELFMKHRWVVGIVVVVRLKATLSIAFPWLSNAITQQSAGSGVRFHLWQQRCWWLKLWVCYVLSVFHIEKNVQIFNQMFLWLNSWCWAGSTC